MKKKITFRGVATALVTPFFEDGIDFNTLGRLIDLQVGAADAIVVAGTTGEAPTLSERERDALLAFTLARVDGRLPVIMGTGSNDTKKAVEMTRRAAELGADGVLTVTPYYNRGTRGGVRKHFLSVAEASDAPVILYNVPSRTGGSLSLEDYDHLLPHPNILGVKEAEDNTEKFFALCESFGKTRAVYTGNDSFLLPALALGGAGVISVVSNLFPLALKSVIRLYWSHDTLKARAVFSKIFPLCRLLFAETNPAPVKDALCTLGYGNGVCRLPLDRVSEKLSQMLKSEILRLSQEDFS